MFNCNNSLAESENFKSNKLIKSKLESEKNKNSYNYVHKKINNNIQTKFSDNERSKIINNNPNLLEKKIYKVNDIDKENSKQFKSFKEGKIL